MPVGESRGGAALSAAEAYVILDELRPVVYSLSDEEIGKRGTPEEAVGFSGESVPDLLAGPGGKGYKPLDLVAVLTAALQDQRRTIARLESRIAALEAAR